MTDTKFVRLNSAKLNDSVLGNIGAETADKAFIEETLNAALRDELTDALKLSDRLGSLDPERVLLCRREVEHV